MFWDHLTSWPGSLHILPGLPIHQSVILHGMLSAPERPCGPRSLVKWHSHDTDILFLEACPDAGNGKSSLSKMTATSLLTLWRPPSSTAIPLLAFREVPASRLLGQRASLLGLRNRLPAEWATWTVNSDDSNNIPIGSLSAPLKEWQTNITQRTALTLTYYPLICTCTWCGGDREGVRNSLKIQAEWLFWIMWACRCAGTNWHLYIY